jgi:GT2 family glycosyltransferase
MRAKSDSITTESQAAMPPPATQVESHIFASLDFAHLAGGKLLLYGWILGFATRVESALIEFEKMEIDLGAYTRKLRRPDVSQHFAAANDEHGFYALIDLPQAASEANDFRLRISLLSGETQESRWTIQRHGHLSAIPRPDMDTLRAILPHLPALDRLRLSRLLGGAPEAENAGLPTTVGLPMQLEPDSCCVLDRRILVVCGSLVDPANELIDIQVSVGNELFDLFTNSVSVPRHNIAHDAVRRHGREAGFILVQVIRPATFDHGEAIFAVRIQDEPTSYVIRPVFWNPHEARRELLALLDKLDLEASMVLMERILSATQALPGMQSLRELVQSNHDQAVKRLPASIQHISQRSRYWLHVDHCIAVAESGVFLSGWCHAENGKDFEVFYRCGEFSFPVSANWIRHTRPDVTTHLETEGAHVPDDEHGFTCYVPLKAENQLPWLSTSTGSGDEWRMLLPVEGHQRSTMETLRLILSAFHSEHRELHALMDRHVGPAVEAVWAARPRTKARVFVESFGKVAADPMVSILVPLFGRWDFAEYQLSQFANDPDFQKVDLIYVVDDPSIFDALRHAAPMLFGIYQIPFTLAFPGANLGFAGANNFGARYARSQNLLLLNSDVLPERPGWVSELLNIHATLASPGVVGAKLIYEDRTLQHAGIEFRRYAPWGGLWINDHPLKGQMLTSLRGTQEVSAVTAACALIGAGLFRELNGLSEDYIIGDFEDSDLCLRARRNGRRNYVALDVTLYHLERQSQNRTGDSMWRSNLTAYNCWLHHQRWSELIEQIAGERP